MPIRHSKTRTGCRACKRKRLKCDETTPACLNCTRRGVQCPGYPTALRWSTKHETLGKYDRGQSSSTSPPPSIDVASDVQTPDTDFSTTAPSSSFFVNPRPMTLQENSSDSPPDLSGVSSAIGFNTQLPFLSGTNLLPLGDVDFLIRDLDGIHIQTSTNSPAAPLPAYLSIWADNNEDHVANSDRAFWQSGYFPCTDLARTNAPPTPPTTTSGIALPFCVVQDPWETQEWPQDSLVSSNHGRGLAISSQHIPAGLNDPSTLLVEFWFRSVCEGWAAYDSPLNPFRRLCASLWTTSGSVYYSIQSMAAASLPAEHSPNIQQIVLAAPEQSTKALIYEIQGLFHDHNAVVTLPAGLLVSLFCMSSSVSWIDSRQLGTQYLRNARAVVELLDLKIALLSRQDRELLEFFRGCLIYEEMLRSIVSEDEEDFSTLVNGREPLPSSPRNTSGDGSMVFHAWTGVPIMLFWLLGKVMVLSRRSRARRGNATDMLCEAKVVEEKLLAADTSNIADITEQTSSSAASGARRHGHTHDNIQNSEVKSHLHLAAEAFKLCALLQLYQAFPELVSLRIPLELDDGPASSVSWLSSLSLHIVDILKLIPPTSGMRCLQPLLCICAGSALKAPSSPQDVDTANRSLESTFPMQLHIDPATKEHLLTDEGSDASFAVHQARHFLRGRLRQLEHLLPRKPVAVAGQLLEEIWSSMDRHMLLESGSHNDYEDWTLARHGLQTSWLDIISAAQFQSVFG